MSDKENLNTYNIYVTESVRTKVEADRASCSGGIVKLYVGEEVVFWAPHFIYIEKVDA